ncbi:amino acid adenylation domain-containing protein [Plantactinospora sp. KLBMP9567]|uniref:non-ribosomal peptide synthetase n=1 Tax=Plantactinospora sp. KLBMP9567 TaxID=3085900 RepID=UPI0029813AB8|nr:amino acid adenylation domain-containing protein [Plantactinospora sp. KLBMP9567]MDW5324849.1 amino acid adenylation domain-containing protein [Plantactinospora sp. KLBMP9567]
MTAGPIDELLSDLRRRQVTLVPEGDELRCTAPPGVLTEELVTELRARKPELLAALRAGAGIPRLDAPPTALSYAQERLWLQAVLRPGDNAYNLPIRVELAGPLRPAALRLALSEVLRRHEVLRTRYRTRRGRPYPVVESVAGAVLPLVDLGALPEDVRQRALDELTVAEARRPFDLAAGPVLRALLARLGGDRHVLLVTRHHIASDGWSLGVLFGELSEVYTALLGGVPHRLPELPIQYADFAAWQREPAHRSAQDAAVRRWTRRLDGARFGLDLLASAAPDTAAVPVRTARLTLAGPAVHRLIETARQRRTTLFTVLLSGFAWALHAVGGQPEIVVGTAVAGRGRLELEPLIGPFATMLPLRLGLGGRPSFGELVERVHEVVRAALDDREVPTERLVEALRPERTLSDNPLFAVAFTLQNTPAPRIRLPELHVTVAPSTPVMPKFALALTATPADDGLDLELEYDPGRLAPVLAARIVELTATVLTDAPARPALPAPTSPGQSPENAAGPESAGPESAGPESADGATSGAARAGTGTGAGAPIPGSGADPAVPGCLHQLVARVAARQPDAIAVTCRGDQLSYRALDVRAGRLARALRARGVGPESLVGLCLEPSLDLVVAALAIVKAGAGYVPIDPGEPAERRNRICGDAGIRVAVTRPGLLGPDVDQLPAAEPARWTAPAPPRPGPPVSPANVAYAIFTSGSTGMPKAVVVTHANLTGVLAGVRSALPASTAARTWSMTHAPTFDVAVFEMWSALTAGDRLVVAPAGSARTPDELWRYLVAERVTMLSQTPAAFGQLAPVALAAGATGGLHAVLLAGENCDVGQLAGWFTATAPGRPVLANLYGITETTVHATFRRLDPSDVAAADRPGGAPGSPIGRPLPGQSVRVRGRRGEPLPDGGSGELFVGGVGLARGYHRRPGLTADRFVPAGPGAVPGVRHYRSGDRGRQLPGGELRYLGRIDDQVKLRGYRIEPGEIEAALTTHPGVRAATVVLSGSARRTHLTGYVVPDAGGPDLDEPGLRRYLAERLPRYMVPARLVLLDALPLTRHGKVDRAELAGRALPAPEGTGRDRPGTETERILATILAELLGFPSVDVIGVRDNLFDLGGDSLLVTQFHARIVETFRVDTPVRRIYQALDIASLAATVDELVARREDEAIRSALAEVTGTAEEDAWGRR